MTETIIKKEEPIMVSIRCITYNHAPYIRRCLDGFVMQKTNFRFQAVVHDDASTDGTTDIVREYAEKYPDIIIPMYEEENRWSKHDGTLMSIMLPYMKGKYWIECEGDDFWTDPYKLQKQVDIMEENPNLSLCYTSFSTVDENGVEYTRPIYDYFRKKSHSGDNLLSLFEYNYIMMLTICMRREFITCELYKRAPYGLDYSLFLTCAMNGDFAYIPDNTGSYRNNQGSATNTRNEAISSQMKEVFFYYANCYIEDKLYKRSFWVDTRIKGFLLLKLSANHKFELAKRVFTYNILIDILIILYSLYSLIIKKGKFRFDLMRLSNK